MGSKGFLLRFFVGLVGSLALVAVVVGWVASGRTAQGQVLGAGAEGGSWATPAELAWLQKLGTWDTRLLRGLQTAAHVESTPGLASKLLSRDSETMVVHARALQPASSCAADLSSTVGPAPTQRLQRAADTFRLACTHLERFHTAISLAVAQGYATQVAQAQNEVRLAGAVLRKADQMLPPGEVRPLPVIAGKAAQSRIEPRFSRVASGLAGKRVEVRCWSSADWDRLMLEERSYTHGKLGSDTLGFAGIGGSRINLGPGVCAGLVQLTYDHARPTDDAGRLLLAAAVVTLSHEPQHTKGIAEEFVAECNGIQLASSTAVKLGASPAYAAALVHEYWRHYNEELPAYRSGDCRKGGKLDLGRADSIWP